MIFQNARLFFPEKVIVQHLVFDAFVTPQRTGTRAAMPDYAVTAKKYADLAARTTDTDLAEAYRNLAEGYELLARGTELLHRHHMAPDDAQ